MIAGKANITEYFRSLQKKHFALYKRGTVESGNVIYKSNEDEGVDPQRAFEEFERILSMLSSGEYTLICNNDPKVTARGSNRVDFRITLDDSLSNKASDAVGGVAGIGNTFTYEDVVTKAKTIAKDEFQALMDKKELEDSRAKTKELEARVAEAEKKVDDPFNKFISAVAPHAESIIGSLMGTKGTAPLLTPAVSGVRPDVQLDDNVDQHAQQVFENFAMALQTAKPNEWLEILVKLTTLIKENPSKFETALNFL